MKQLVIITCIILSSAALSIAAAPTVKHWYDAPVTTTVPDNAKFLINDPGLPPLSSDRTVTTNTLNKQLKPWRMKNMSTGQVRAWIRNSDGALVVGPYTGP